MRAFAEIRVAGVRDVGGRLGHRHAGDQFADQALQIGPVGVLAGDAGLEAFVECCEIGLDGHRVSFFLKQRASSE